MCINVKNKFCIIYFQRLNQSDPGSPTSSSPNLENENENYLPNNQLKSYKPSKSYNTKTTKVRENVRERQNSGNGENKHFVPVVMESSSMFHNNIELSNKSSTKERKRRESYRDNQNDEQNDPIQSSEEENLENLIHLKRALIKHDQTEVPGEVINIKIFKNIISTY